MAGHDERTTILAIEGMSCASCANRIERALKRVEGVASASVNLVTERAAVQATGPRVSTAQLIEAVRRAGYSAAVVEAEQAAASGEQGANRQRELVRTRRRFWISALLTLPLFLVEMGGHLVPALHHALDAYAGERVLLLASVMLSTLVQFGPGFGFYQKGIPALLRGAPDMNSLVVLGTTSAWGYSLVAGFAPHWLPPGAAHQYFEAAAVVVTLVLLGRYLEARSKGRTGAAIQALLGLRVQKAWRMQDGEPQAVAVETVVAGDELLVRPGEQVPVDGVVIGGHSQVDESMISGEPMPVAKAAGDPLVGGSLNGTGSLRLRATAVGSDTVLARIIALVEQAQAAKLPIQAVVDRLTAWFVPAVMLVALASLAVWWWLGPDPAVRYGLAAAVAVLIIACPCAMGLATPTSIMVATGRAAQLGVLFRRGEALQTLREVKLVAFDKTGTLTEGHPQLVDLVLAGRLDEAAVLRLAAALERQSEHPLGSAVVAAATERRLTLAEASDFRAEPGLGIAGTVEGREVAIGSARWMQALNIDLHDLPDEAERQAGLGRTPLFIAVDGAPAALLAVADPIKPGSAPAIAALHRLGLRTAMITGDVQSTANAVARQVGIDVVMAQVLPSGKQQAIEALQGQHGRVVFVGDGINDAPALAQADVGIAIGTGTDVAIESAQVVLMSGDPAGVVRAIALSHATMRNIRQNLFWAFGYNAVLIPVAAGIFYPWFGWQLSPAVGAAAMALSSVFVLTNALRLRRWNAVAS